jgi:hypothetical protein
MTTENDNREVAYQSQRVYKVVVEDRDGESGCARLKMKTWIQIRALAEHEFYVICILLNLIQFYRENIN